MSLDQPRHHILMAEAKDLSPRATEILQSAGDAVLAQLTRSEMAEMGGDVSVLWLKLGTKVDGELLSAFPSLKCLAVNTTGVSHIDLEALSARGIQLLSLKGESDFLKDVRATAELTIALILSLLRRTQEAFVMAESGSWRRMEIMGEDLAGKTVGLIGFGRLGRITADLLLAFRAKVLWCDVAVCEPMAGAERAELDTLLARSDIVSVHASWMPGDPPLLGRREFCLMKPGAHLINTARGELIDEEALLEALTMGRLKAALDVLKDEQGHDLAENCLVKFAQLSPSLLLTPHIGGATRESSEKTEVFMAEKIKAWCKDNPL